MECPARARTSLTLAPPLSLAHRVLALPMEEGPTPPSAPSAEAENNSSATVPAAARRQAVNQNSFSGLNPFT